MLPSTDANRRGVPGHDPEAVGASPIGPIDQGHEALERMQQLRQTVEELRAMRILEQAVPEIDPSE